MSIDASRFVESAKTLELIKLNISDIRLSRGRGNVSPPLVEEQEYDFMLRQRKKECLKRKALHLDSEIS